MRRKLALLLATALAGGMIALGGAAPAHACDEVANDPVYNWVCDAVHNAPPVKDTVVYYVNLAADVAFGTAHWAYCQVSPYC